MAELRHAPIAAAAVFVLLVAAGISASGMAIFQWPLLALFAAISIAGAVADVVIRRRRGISIK